MTIREMAEKTGIAYRTICKYAQQAGWTKNGKKTELSDEQVTLLLEAVKAPVSSGTKSNLASQMQGTETNQPEKNMSKEPLGITGNKKLTTAEVCTVLGCNTPTLMRNWREIETFLAPEKVKTIENGKPTFWTETEVTLLLEKMKGNAKNQHDLASQIKGIETSMTLDLQIAMAERAEKEAVKRSKELWKRKAERLEQQVNQLECRLGKTEQVLGQEVIAHDRTRRGLELYQRIAENAGAVRTDREDLMDTYRR